MRNHCLLAGVLAAITIASFQTASAQLPTLDNEPWRGYFAVHAGKRFQFGIQPNGAMELKVLDRDGSAVGHRSIEIVPIVAEAIPEGKTAYREIDIETLTSTDAPSDKLVKAVYKAKTKTGVSLEITAEESRGFILLGGRLLDPETIKNPVYMLFVIRMPGFYYQDMKTIAETENERDKKKLIKAMEKKNRGDHITLKWLDGTRVKHALTDSVAFNSKEINGPGITEFEMEVSEFPDRKFSLTASPNSSMKLAHPKDDAMPIYEGYAVLWSPDAAKDPENKARVAIMLK